LHQSRKTLLACHLSKRCVPLCLIGIVELYAVEYVEKFGTELDIGTGLGRNRKILDRGKTPLRNSGRPSIRVVAALVAVGERRRSVKAGRVEPQYPAAIVPIPTRICCSPRRRSAVSHHPANWFGSNSFRNEVEIPIVLWSSPADPKPPIAACTKGLASCDSVNPRSSRIC